MSGYFTLQVKNEDAGQYQLTYLLYQVVLRDSFNGSKYGEVLLHSQYIEVDVGLGAHPRYLSHLEHFIDFGDFVPIDRDEP